MCGSTLTIPKAYTKVESHVESVGRLVRDLTFLVKEVPENDPLVSKRSARAASVLRNKKFRETKKGLSMIQLVKQCFERSDGFQGLVGRSDSFQGLCNR